LRSCSTDAEHHFKINADFFVIVRGTVALIDRYGSAEESVSHRPALQAPS
jgi:hypothetical protein